MFSSVPLPEPLPPLPCSLLLPKRRPGPDITNLFFVFVRLFQAWCMSGEVTCVQTNLLIYFITISTSCFEPPPPPPSASGSINPFQFVNGTSLRWVFFLSGFREPLFASFFPHESDFTFILLPGHVHPPRSRPAPPQEGLGVRFYLFSFMVSRLCSPSGVWSNHLMGLLGFWVQYVQKRKGVSTLKHILL